MAPAPQNLGGAKTLFYAVVTPLERWTATNRIVVAGEEQGTFAGLAICEGQDAYYLFYCDAEWNICADGWWQSVEAAKRQAEFEYEGISSRWAVPSRG